MPNEKDIVSKQILKRIAVDIAQILFHLKVDEAEILETEYQRTEERRADLVARMKGEDGPFILHIEIQNSNDLAMPVRMLRYRTDIIHAYREEEIQQYLVYIGKRPLTMEHGIQQAGLDYRYQIIDMHKVDCQTMIAQNNPDALVLAILCDFKGKPAREMLHFLIQRLQELTADNEKQFREYLSMMEILSTNRDLQQILKEEEKMLSQIKQSELPSYQLGAEFGIQQGMQQGEGHLLARLIQKRFGDLPEWAEEKITQATIEQLEIWGDNILEANTLDEVFS
ncbi:MAG: DUF4351 domain-containing protein [Gammaproteobacteria bacterium]|jgi:hypothetical protein|nr:DUF4351 domain-containing protein [Gammaproteobacteria bacterium]